MTEIWAHQGSAESVRPNTVAAFEAARELGADGVELDVRLTADGVLIVHHDAVLSTGEPIRELRAGVLPSWLPTLEQALDACGDMTVNVEVKTDDGIRIVSDPGQRTARASGRLCAAREHDGGRLVISAFSRRALDAVREEAPALELAWLVTARALALDPVAVVVERGYAGLHSDDPMVDEGLVAAARAAGLALRVWTVDDPDRVAALAVLGVDAVITNNVVAVQSVLGRR